MVQATAAAERTSTSKAQPTSSTPVQSEILDKVKYNFGKISNLTPRDVYNGAAWSVREHLIDSFERTHDYWA